MTVVLFHVRHGETDWNVEGRLQGQRDIGLNARGRGQAAEAARRLARLTTPADLPWRVSPLGRARETAEIARRSIGLAPEAYEVDPRLAEITFGEWEGLTWPEVRAKDPAGAAARERDKWGFVPPGGESYAMLVERVRPVLADLVGPTIVVSHGGVARALLVLLAGVSPARAPAGDIHQGRVLVFSGGRAEWT